MALVITQVAGGRQKPVNADTVGEAASEIDAEGYTATVNGNPQPASYVLDDDDFVSFAKPVKAGK